MTNAAEAKAAGLPCWSGPVDPEPISGGITNSNFVVSDGGGRYFVRIGDDIPVHGILRFNEVAAAQAAERAGVSPALIYSAPGAIVTRFIEGRTLAPEDLRQEARLASVVALIQAVHGEMAQHLRGPLLAFWPFHVIRDYAARLRQDQSAWVALLNDLLARADRLEADLGPIRLVFAHNDLLAGNFIDDGERLWLVDWDYAGFNAGLFDLANLSSNNAFTAALDAQLLTLYEGAPADAAALRRLAAMKCVSLLRETLWSMVSEIHSQIDFDYVTYSDDYLARFEAAYYAYSEA